MKRLFVRLAVAILAFVFGVVAERIFISRTPVERPKVERCDPSRIEVKTVFVPPAAPPPVQIFDIDVQAPPLAGTFYLHGKIPAAFNEFDFLDLSWWEPNDDGEIVGDGTIGAQANGVFDRQRTLIALVTRRRVLLITESESGNGFGYRFDGEFVQHKDLEALAKTGKPVLRGTLTKTKKGKKVAEAAVTFWLEQRGYC